MEAYIYHPLHDGTKTVRFFDLLPGSFDDGIRVHLFQTTLAEAFPISALPTVSDIELGPTLADIAQTVGPEWEVHENLEGRFLFRHRETHETSYLHPEAHVRRDSYTRRAAQIPAYEAISYTWGSTDELARIHVDTYESGSKKSRDLLIPQNLAELLRHLRHVDRPRTLWADSISINQHNIPERNAHVKRMAEIYGFAQRVIAWLGPPSLNSELAIKSLDLCATQFEYTTEWQRVASPHGRHPTWSQDGTTIPFEPEAWQAILDLLNRPWFDRLWIMQEIQLANVHSIIQCGPHFIDWPRFRRSILLLRDMPGVPSVPLFNRLVNLWRVVAPVKNVDFLRLISRAQQQKCHDQRDKVYGVLSLAGPQIRDLIQPQYAQSVQSVFRDAFEAIVKYTQRLEILSYCIEEEKRLSDMPSWIPDWTVFPREPMGHLFSNGTANLTAGHTRAYVEFESGGILRVAAIRVGKVEKVHSKVPKTPAESLEAFKQWKPTANSYPTGEDPMDAFVLTLIQTFVSERFARSPVLPGHVIPTKQQTQAVLDFMDHDTLPEKIHEDVTEVLLKSQDRAFIEIQGGYFGIAAKTAQEGDYICTILGCDHLMLLRPSPNNTYSVVGPAYAHGLWDGEPILGKIPNPWSMKLVKDKTGIELPCFFNSSTGDATFEDPRLEALPKGWRRVVKNRRMEDPLTFAAFEDEVTGEKLGFDPRVSREVLEAKGLPIEMLSLV